MIGFSFFTFILIGIFNAIGIFKIANIVKQNKLQATRKYLFIDIKNLKKQLKMKGAEAECIRLKKALIFITLSKFFFILTLLIFGLSIKW